MSYLVIARKYRPQTFASIVGQEHITVALANAIIRDRVPHALLFTGPRGVGKTTTARVLSKALNCTGRAIPKNDVAQSKTEVAAWTAVEPCGACPNCQEIAKSSSISVWEIDGASHNGVDNVRDLIDSLRTMPPQGSTYKIYIIDEVHMLSTAAFNALLKSLEEPPPNTIFVFATTEPHKIPATVISRCQRHDFRRVPDPVIVSALRGIAEDQQVQVSDDVLWFVARRSFGGMRDAQSSFDRLISFSAGQVDMAMAEAVFGVVGRGFFFELSQAVLAHDTERCLVLLDQVFKGSVDLRSFLSDYLAHWRNLMLVVLSAETKASIEGGNEWSSLETICDFTQEEIGIARKQVEGSSSFDLQRIFEFAEKSVQSSLMSNYPRYLLEAGLAKMASTVPVRPLAEVVSQLDGWLRSGAATAPVSKQIAAREQRVASPLSPTTAAPVRPTAFLSSSAGPSSVAADIPSEDALPTEAQSFNPSWEEFVNYVKSTNQVLLASHLRRVTADSFSCGKLSLKGGAFDISSLRDADTQSVLKRCLHGYSGVESWNIVLDELKSEPTNIPVNKSALNKSASSPGKRVEKSTDYVSGSLARKESESEQAISRRLEEESRNDPIVQAALSTFKGSRIERINITKK